MNNIHLIKPLLLSSADYYESWMRVIVLWSSRDDVRYNWDCICFPAEAIALCQWCPCVTSVHIQDVCMCVGERCVRVGVGGKHSSEWQKRASVRETHSQTTHTLFSKWRHNTGRRSEHTHFVCVCVSYVCVYANPFFHDSCSSEMWARHQWINQWRNIRHIKTTTATWGPDEQKILKINDVCVLKVLLPAWCYCWSAKKDTKQRNKYQ